MENSEVFISYCHKDNRHLERLKTYLRDFERRGQVSYFDATQIQPGDDWRGRIDNALASARVAMSVSG